jgi:hypothetical protein
MITTLMMKDEGRKTRDRRGGAVRERNMAERKMKKNGFNERHGGTVPLQHSAGHFPFSNVPFLPVPSRAIATTDSL